MANRFSAYSNNAAPAGAARSAAQQSTQVSTTTLLNTLHTIYTSGQTYPLDASTSLAINTWLTAANPNREQNLGGNFDIELARTAWEHARRRAEDGCIVLGSLHQSTPSLFSPFLSAIPVPTPQIAFTALAAIRPFLTCVTPYNHATSRHSSIAATYSITLAGKITGLTIALSLSGIDVERGLLNIPSEPGYRAFDAFYYLLTSASTAAEREFLGLKPAAEYSLLKKSGTYDPPAYLPAADDAAAAEDFRAALKAIGIKGSVYRGFLSALVGLLKLGETTKALVGNEDLEEICEDVGGLIGVEPEVLAHKCTALDREIFIAGAYEALVDWVIARANEAISNELLSLQDGASDDNNEDSVSITVVEIPGESLGKAVALRSVFDDNLGINAEMKEDGVELVPAGHSVLKEVANAVAEVEADLGISGGPLSREREQDHNRREGILERIGEEAEDGGFLKTLLYPVEGEGLNFGKKGRFDLATLIGSSRVWYQLSLHPTDDAPATLATLPSTTSAWSAGAVSRQLRAWRLPEWANRRNKNLDFTADFDVEEFHSRYSRLGCKEGKDGVESFLLERGWSNGEVVIGKERIWMREGAWWEAESMLDMKPLESRMGQDFGMASNPFATGYSANAPHNGSGFFAPLADNTSIQDSHENLLDGRHSTMGRSVMGGGKSAAPTIARTIQTNGGDYGLGAKGDDKRDQIVYEDDLGRFAGELDPEFGDPKKIQQKSITFSRRVWIAFVWACTFFVPSFLLRFIGRMKRPDVRMAWREKVVLVLLIFLLNATVVFYMIAFGRLLCPNWDKAWNQKEVSYHQGDDDFWVSIHGKVYDISKFWKLQHSDTNIETNAANMQPFAGMNLDVYFEPPLSRACPGLDIDESVVLQHNDTNAVMYPQALHTSGERYQADPTTALRSWDWYNKKFLPKIAEYYKGDLVITTEDVYSQGQNDARRWVIVNNNVYDLTDYFYTLKRMNNFEAYQFFPSSVTDLVEDNPGTDVSESWGSNAAFQNSLNCMNNAFFVGKTDFRKTAKCQVNNYILLAFAIVLCAVILVKFLAALQLGSKRHPAAQDKFVICQVPAYTEGEDQLRKGLDSLTALQYDNKRKLICVICDGMIVGGGNDRPTPKIVLDILGVDPKVDPPALPFKSVGNGSEQLNYGKVYSGLYEYEGNVVPYIVVVKVGKESEQTKTKPGNRGKRDSQILLMQFLNRVHHRSSMSPLELEMFHQINNIIGVDPELYEYLLMVDADTSVKEDSLNRFVASCANDAKIAGICGETSLENEERSWWTMIQVYEYYISHHLAKAFESLFGSVTCLPGCFCMYRLRTADKGRPLIISDKVISEYADCEVDTLHKKNLLSLGEDRYLTTLMTKHFPAMSYKFIPDAYASTAAPETWSVLLSQRRRWINSTIHNLAELVFLKDLCGFCCFSMRFVVFIDLFGTVILPATCVYLGYLIYRVATNSGQFPLISIIMIAAVYGLQAVIFIIKRQWQHVGWMIIYILAFPIYSFVLPIYSFWNQDNFSWGNTRIVIGEKGNKQIIAVQDEGFDPRSIPLQRWDDYALQNNLPGRRGNPGASQEKVFQSGYEGAGGMEMDDIHSTYSSVKPASTIVTGFPQQHQELNNAPPRLSTSLGGVNAANRASTMTGLTQYRDQPISLTGRHVSVGNMSDRPYRDSLASPYQSGVGMPYSGSRLSLLGMPTSDSYNIGFRQSMGSVVPFGTQQRMSSNLDFRSTVGSGPDDGAIVEAVQNCLREVDLDNITKKQVRALVEQRLQTELAGERRTFLDRQIDNELANM